MPYNTIQYKTIQYEAIQYNTNNTIQYKQYNTPVITQFYSADNHWLAGDLNLDT